MSITRIDCNFFRSPNARIDRSCFVALNPARRPGCMVLGLSAATNVGLGSQLACKLALESFVGEVIEFFEPHAVSSNSSAKRSSPNNSRSSSQALALKIDQQITEQGVAAVQDREPQLLLLEQAFKVSNREIYDLGHRLGAGGRLGAALLGLVVMDDFVATGRVGGSALYLFRQGELFPFFAPKDSKILDGTKISSSTNTPELSAPELLVGQNSVISVELSSIPIEEGDTIMIFPRELSNAQQESLISDLSDPSSDKRSEEERLAERFFRDLYIAQEIELVATLKIGPQAIYLSKAELV